jgi:hypothetical protein
MPVRPTEKYYKQIQEELARYFYDLYWRDILKEVEKADKLYNARNVLLEAIRSGKVHYENGVFTGEFNISLSRELSKFAEYNSRKKIWTGIPPSNISAAAMVANERGRALAERINKLISEIPGKVEAAISDLKYSIDTPLFMASDQAGKDLKSLGIRIDMTPELSDRLIREYTGNMDLNIKNWTDEQVVRLRQMIEKNTLSGYNKMELQKLIMAEYGVTMNKSRFLARNETMLFVSSVARERYGEAGVRYYIWSTSHDNRVVGTPGGLYPEPTKGHGNHYNLNGKVCRLDDPSVFADSIEAAKKGRWKSKSSIGTTDSHPGQDYQCRCTMKPIII